MNNLNQDEYAENALQATIPPDEILAPGPNNPPWNSVVALIFWLVSVIFILAMPLLFLIPYITKQNINLQDSKAIAEFASSDPTAVLIQIGAIIPAHILTLILAWFIVTRFNKYSFTKMLGWHWNNLKWWQIIGGTLVLLLAALIVGVITNVIFGSQDNELLKILRSSRYAVFLVAFMATFSAPLVEEVVNRGVLYSAFQRTFNVPLAIIFVTFVFAIVHFPQYWGDNSTLVTLTFLSLVITLIRVKTNSLLPCIFFHFIINGIQSLLLILQPYLPEALDPTTVKGFFF